MSPRQRVWCSALCALAVLPAAVVAARAEPLQLVALTPALDGDPGMPAAANELDCLALNIYWEARAEPRLGQVAVAAVTLNRVAASAFPDTVCAVVRQGEERGRNLCQFSWHCDGLDDRPRNPAAWQHAQRLARLALAGQLPDPTGGALWFHSDQVHPDWAADMTRIGQIGTHVFYRLAAASAGRSASIDPPDLRPAASASTSDPPARKPPGAHHVSATWPAALPLVEGDPSCTDQAAVAMALASSSPQQFLSLVDELRLGDERPPCQGETVRDPPPPRFALARAFPERLDGDPFEAILPSGTGLADAGASARQRWLSGSFGPATGRGGALTPRDLPQDRAPPVGAPARVAKAAIAPPEQDAVPAVKAQVPARGLLAASIRLAQAAIPRLPMVAPAELLRAFEPPVPIDRLPARPF